MHRGEYKKKQSVHWYKQDQHDHSLELSIFIHTHTHTLLFTQYQQTQTKHTHTHNQYTYTHLSNLAIGAAAVLKPARILLRTAQRGGGAGGVYLGRWWRSEESPDHSITGAKRFLRG